MRLFRTTSKAVGEAFSATSEGKLFVLRFGRVAIIWDLKRWSGT